HRQLLRPRLVAGELRDDACDCLLDPAHSVVLPAAVYQEGFLPVNESNSNSKWLARASPPPPLPGPGHPPTLPHGTPTNGTVPATTTKYVGGQAGVKRDARTRGERAGGRRAASRGRTRRRRVSPIYLPTSPVEAPGGSVAGDRARPRHRIVFGWYGGKFNH